MANEKPEPLAERLDREITAAHRLRKTKPWLFTILVFGVVLWGAWKLYDQSGKISALKEEVAKRDQRILLLETQISPFRALAIDRFPGAKEGEAIGRLALQIEKLQDDFQKAQQQLKSFAVRLTVVYHAEWKEGKIPDASHLFRKGGGSSGTVVFGLADGKELPVLFTDSTEVRIDGTSPSKIKQSYLMTANPGCPIFGYTLAQLRTIRRVDGFLWDFSKDSVANDEFTIDSIFVEILVDGVIRLETGHAMNSNRLPISPDNKGAQGFSWNEVSLLSSP
jgi:hypothetical protein